MRHRTRATISLAAAALLPALALTAPTANAATVTHPEAAACFIQEEPGDIDFTRSLFPGEVFPGIAGPFGVTVTAVELADVRAAVAAEDYGLAAHRDAITVLLDACEAGEDIRLPVTDHPAGSAISASAAFSSESTGLLETLLATVRGGLAFLIPH